MVIDRVGDDDGGYNFAGDGTCAFADTNKDGTTGVYCAHISSVGTYEDIMAGTGDATGGAGASTTIHFGTQGSSPCNAPASDAAVEGGSNSVSYTITFAAGTGPLTISSYTTAGDGDVGSGVGTVNIVPTAGAGPCIGGGPCVPGINQDVSAFTVSGGFHVAG